MADARPLLRIRGGIKAQGAGSCRGVHRADERRGGGQGTHGGACVGQRCSCRSTCAASRRRLVVRWHPSTRGGSGSHSRGTLATRSTSPAPVVLGFPPPAVHILFRARPAVQSAYDANSTFVIRPDALAGFAAALLVPRYVAGVRGVEDEKPSPLREDESIPGEDESIPSLDSNHTYSINSGREGGRIHSRGGRIHSLIRLQSYIQHQQ